MKLLVRFETPHTYWTPLLVFKNFHSWMESYYSDHLIVYENTKPDERSNPSGVCSAHIMTMRNVSTKKYIIVSYWDEAIELTWEGNGWDDENKVELITSSGVHSIMNYTPFSYTCYNLEFEKLSDLYRKPLNERTNNNLFFRGHLYGDRKLMQLYKPQYFAKDKVELDLYFEELNDSKISLSLDGAGEICNRDMEILCNGGVLLRPALTQKFHNELLPDVHYIAVQRVSNPVEQFDLLLKKYEEIKDNTELLNNISNNGLEWFKANGSMTANVELLKKIVDLDKLR